MSLERFVGALVVLCVLMSVATVALDAAGVSSVGRFAKSLESGKLWEMWGLATSGKLKLVAECNATGVKYVYVRASNAYIAIKSVNGSGTLRVYSDTESVNVSVKGCRAAISVSNGAFVVEVPANVSVAVRIENAMALVKGRFREVALNATRCGVRVDAELEKLVVRTNNAYLEAFVKPFGRSPLVSANVTRAMVSIRIYTLGLYGVDKDVKYTNAIVKVSIKEPETPKYKVTLRVRASECILGVEAGE